MKAPLEMCLSWKAGTRLAGLLTIIILAELKTVNGKDGTL
jgi:hypothetical protein